MVGQVADQGRVVLGAAQPERLEGGIPLAENVGGALVQLLEQRLELSRREGILGVLPVAEGNLASFQQGDRLATGASGALADQLEHGWRAGDSSVNGRGGESQHLDATNPRGHHLVAELHP